MTGVALQLHPAVPVASGQQGIRGPLPACWVPALCLVPPPCWEPLPLPVADGSGHIYRVVSLLAMRSMRRHFKC